MSDSIKVAVRIRPLIQRETDAGSKISWHNDDKTLQQKGGTGKCGTPYSFDRVFGVEESTDDVFTEIAVPIVEGAMLGFNGTIFAYGQTSSGKTFTMMGTERQPGIIPCVVKEIFDTIECNPDREYLIRVSYLEIYNENVTDLLARNNKPLDVREDTKGNVFVTNLKEEPVNNITQILQLMASGEESRHVGTTNMNERSSRSHAIFSLIIESRIRDQEGAVMVSHLNLVDLAGSEKAKATGASGQRLMEGGFINKSLFILGNVISQLSEGVSFISYRDSRLTRILQNSLGGNSKTAIICNISPAALEETHSSLRFATNAKRIKNKPIQNEVLSDEAMLQRYKKEIDLLKKKLEKTRNGKVQEENEVLQQQLADKEDMISRLTNLICVSSRIRPSTPNMKSGDAKRKRRETWCPGKTGRLAVPKMAPLASFSDIDMPPPAKAGRSLPVFDEEEESPAPHEVKFKLPMEESPEIERPELTVNMSRFSNEDLEMVHTGCQTEFSEDCVEERAGVDPLVLASREEKIQELTQQLQASRDEVSTLNQILDTNLEGEGKRVGELQLEVFDAKEENRLLKEKLAASESNEVEHLEQLCAVQKELEALRSTQKTSRPSVGGLELVNSQLDLLRRQLEEAKQEIIAKDKQHSEAVQLAEEALDDVNNLKNEMTAVQKERDFLQIQLEDFKIQMEKREEEFKEIEEFLTCERDFKNDSIMGRQIGEDMVSDLKRKLSELERTSVDSQQLIKDLNKTLSTSSTEMEDLKIKLKQTEKELAQLTNEKGDFDMCLELEREKHKRRTEELTAQLQEAYRENSELRASGGPVAEGHSLDMSMQAALASFGGGPMAGGNLEASMQAANNLQVEQLNAQITELQEQLVRLTEEMQLCKADKETAEKQLEENQEAMSHNKDLTSEHMELINKLEEEISDLKQQMECMRAELEKSNEEKLLIQEEKGKLMQEKSNLEEQKVSELDEDSRNKLEGEISDLKNEIESIKVELEISNKEKIIIQEEKNNLMQEKANMEEQRGTDEDEDLKTKFVEEISDLKNQIECLEVELERSNEQKVLIQEEKDKLTQEKSDVEEQRGTEIDEDLKMKLSEEISELKKQIECLHVELERSNEEKVLIQEEKDKLMQEKSDLEEQRETEIDEDLKLKLSEEVSELKNQIECFRVELEKSNNEKVLIQEEKDKLMQEKSNFEEQRGAELETLEEARQEVSRLESKLQLLQNKIIKENEDRDGQEKTRLEEALSTLKEEFELQRSEEKETAERELHEQIVAIREEAMQKLEEAKASLQQPASADDEQVSTTQKDEQIALHMEDKKRLEEEVSMLYDQIKCLTAESEKAEEEKALLQEEKDEAIKVKSELQEQTSAELEALEEARKEVVRLEEELNQLQLKIAKDDETRASEEEERLENALTNLQEDFERQRLQEKQEAEEHLLKQVAIIREEAMQKLEEAKAEIQKPEMDGLEQESVSKDEEQSALYAEEKKRLEDEISSLKDQIENLQVELKKSNEENDLTEQKIQLEEENCSLKEQIERLQIDLQKSSEESNLAEQQNQLEDENSTLRHQVESLQNKLQKSAATDVPEQRTQLENEISTLKEKVECLQVELQKSTEEKDRIQKEKEDLRNDLEKQNKHELETLEEAHKEIARLEEELSQLNLKVETGNMQREAEEENRLTEALSKLKEEHEAEHVRVKEEAEKELREQIASIREEAMQKLEEAKAALEKPDPDESCLVDQETQLLMLKLQIEELNSILKEKDREIQLGKVKASTLEKKLETLKDEDKQTIDGLYAEIETLQKGTLGIVTGVKEERDAAWNTIEKLNEELDRLTKLEEDFKQQEEDVKQQEELNKQELEQLKEEAEQLRECVGEHEAELQKEHEHVATLEDMVTDLKRALKEAEEEKEEAQNLRKFEEEVLKLQSEKEVLESKYADKIQKLEVQMNELRSENNVEPLQKKIKELKEFLASVEEERNEARNLIDALDNEMENMKQEREKLEKELNEKITNLQVELSQIKSENSQPVQDNTGAQEQIKDLEESLKFMREERDEARELIDAVDEEIEQVKQEKTDLEKKISDLQTELKQAQSNKSQSGGKDMEAFEMEVKDLKESLEFMREERDEARNLIDTVDEEIEQVKQEKGELEKQMSEKISHLEAELKRSRSSRESSQDNDVTTLQRENKKLQHLLKRTEEERDWAQRSKILKGEAEAASGSSSQEVLRLQQKLARAEMQLVKGDSEKEKMKLLEEEIRSLKERINSQKIEIRRLQNQLSETSYVCPPKRPQSTSSAPSRASEGIIGSVKVLTMESENAALQRRVKSLESEREKIMTEHKTVVKKLKDQQHMMDEYKMKIRNFASDERLRDLSNGTSQVRPSQKTKKALPVGDETFVPQDGVDYFRLLLGEEEEDKDVPEGLFQKDPRSKTEAEEPNPCAQQ